MKPNEPPTPVLPTKTARAASPRPPDAGQDALGQNDEVAIYSAVIRQLYLVDHTFAELPSFPVVYLLRITDDSVGDPNAPRAREPHEVSATVQESVISALAAQPDLPAKFVWVDSRDQVPMDAYSRVEGNGAIFTLGNIHPQPDGTVLVPASLYFASLGAGGRTYILRLMDGTWQIVGDTGVEWIS